MTPESSAGFGSSLLRAVSAGRPRQVRLLVDSGADVNFSDDCEQTPLMRVMFLENSRTQLKIVKTLLKNGAKVSSVDIIGRTALSWACLRGCDLVLPTLLSYSDGKLDLNRRDMNGCTALYHAVTSGSAKTVKLMVSELQKYKLSVDIPNLQGVTPLMQALRLGNDICASVLVHQGQASLTVRDENFLNAGDWADKAGQSSKYNNSKVNTLPIIQESTPQNKARAYRALRRNQRIVAVERELSSDEDSNDSSNGSDSSFVSLTTDGGSASGYDSDFTRITPEAVSHSFSDSLGDNLQLSGEEDVDSVSTPVNQLAKRQPQPSQVKVQNDLPSIYDMYGKHLSKSYRPGYIPKCGRENTPIPDVFHEGCSLECCEKPKSALLRFSDQKIQRVARVFISARSKEEKVTSGTAKRQKGKNQSLRKAIAEKRLREPLPNLIEEKAHHRPTDSSVSMATQQNGTSLPAISNKLFLVSGRNSPTDAEL